MRGALLLSICLAAGTQAGLIFKGNDLPGDIKHKRNHMDFHKHQVRDDETPAEEMMDKFSQLYSSANNGEDFSPFGHEQDHGGHGQGWGGHGHEWQHEHADQPPPSPVAKPAASPSSDADETRVTTWVNGEELVTVTVHENHPQEAPAPVENPVPKPAPKPAPKPQPQPEVHAEAKPPAAKPAPSKPKPATPSPASNALSGLPSAPADFIEDLESDSPVYKAIALLHHNIHRTNHSLPPLSWNDTLFESAKQMAQGCVYEHTQPTPPYGQNIAAGNAPGNVSADITNGFYNGEIGLFHQAIGEFGNNSPDMTDFEHWGHATQMLWKETTSVACYTASCAPSGADPLQCGPEGSYLKNVGCGNGGTRAFNLVCNYYPPGNYPDQYSSVPAPADIVAFVEMTAEGVVGLPAHL